jgi:hypothetical protein
MPRKRRTPKRRIDRAVELKAWTDLFETGFDFFDDLDEFGLVGDENKRTAARSAWKRLGAEFMHIWREKPHFAGQMLWAFEQFGEPPCQ